MSGPTPSTPDADRDSTSRPRAGGGEVRRRLDRAPGERYRAAAEATAAQAAPGRTPARRLAAALAVALGTAAVLFVLITVDIGPGILVVGLAGGWLTGLAIAGGARAGTGAAAGTGRAVTAAVLAGGGVALGLLFDALRAYAIGGVLLPWEYALARFGWLAPAAIALGAIAGALRGR